MNYDTTSAQQSELQSELQPASQRNETALKAAKLWLRHVPDSIHSMLLSRLLNVLLKPARDAEQLLALEGKRIAIRLSDTGNRWDFRVAQSYLRTGDQHLRPHALIQGSMLDFVCLATRTEDPDTLFFHRRLSLEGETETGLLVKNLLDSLDVNWEDPLIEVLGPTLANPLTRIIERSGLPQIAHRNLLKIVS